MRLQWLGNLSMHELEMLKEKATLAGLGNMLDSPTLCIWRPYLLRASHAGSTPLGSCQCVNVEGGNVQASRILREEVCEPSPAFKLASQH